jgi:phosphoribosylformylglycinamidine synthase subunit PurS
MFNAEIYIALKKTVADPQGLTVKHALESLGYGGVKDVRMGKLVRISLDTKDKSKAEAEVKGMCEELLANTVIEEFSFKIEEAK